MPVPFCLATSRISSISRSARRLVHLAEDVAGDLHQVAVQFSVVPSAVHPMQFVVVQAKTAFHQVVGLGDQLHHRVLDAVVDHFHEVTGRSRTQVGYARIAVDLGGHRLKTGRTRSYASFGPPGIMLGRGAPLLRRPTRHAEELNAFRRQVAGTQVCVFEVRVAGVDDEIALFRCGNRSSMTESTERRRAPASSPRAVGEAGRTLRCSPRREHHVPPIPGAWPRPGRIFVVTRHRIAVVGHVQYEIAPHDAQADHADFILLLWL